MHKKNIIIILSVIFLAFLFWSSLALQNIFYDLVVFLGYYIEEMKFFGYFVFVILAAASALFSLFSSVLLVPFAVLVWGPLLTTVLLFFGWIIGGILGYLIGYYAGYLMISKFIAIEKIKNYQEIISRKIDFWLILLFRLAMPAEIPAYTLGISRYHFGKYLLATFIAELPFAFAVVYLSEALVEFKPVVFLIWIIFIAIFMGLFFHFFHRRLKQNKLSVADDKSISDK
ncbi:MAG: VTT domain-containing protein [Patescibacteria group bacterium]